MELGLRVGIEILEILCLIPNFGEANLLDVIYTPETGKKNFL